MKHSPKKNPFKYYFAGTQIALTVAASMFVGHEIDKFLNNNKYIVTIIFATAAILACLYALIKDVNKE